MNKRNFYVGMGMGLMVGSAAVFSTATATMSSTTVAMMVHSCPRPSCSSWWCSW